MKWIQICFFLFLERESRKIIRDREKESDAYIKFNCLLYVSIWTNILVPKRIVDSTVPTGVKIIFFAISIWNIFLCLIKCLHMRYRCDYIKCFIFTSCSVYIIFQPKDKFVLYSFFFHPRNQKENYFLLLTLENLFYFQGDSRNPLKKSGHNHIPKASVQWFLLPLHRMYNSYYP